MVRKTKDSCYEYSRDGIKQSVLRNARSIKVPQGWAEQIAERVACAIDKWIADKELVTEDDIRLEMIKELEPLNPDLAFAYQNHDKII
jgi:hypothetical protein